ncbi:MAG TPA: transcription elongation factor GreA [Patescibacteria group bacterium]
MPKAQKADQPQVVQITKQGLEELQAELQQLNQVKLPEVVKRVAAAREYGDLSENAEYHDAKEEQRLIESRIDQIQNVLDKAQVVQNTKSTSKVGMGSTVIVSLAGKKGKTFTFHIVGEFEANPSEGKISVDSPTGRALIGKKKSDKVEVAVPAGTVSYIIEDIK